MSSAQIYRESKDLDDRVLRILHEKTTMIPFAKVTYEVQIGPMAFPPKEPGGPPQILLGGWVAVFAPHPLLGKGNFVRDFRVPYDRSKNDDVLSALIEGRLRELWDDLEKARVEAGLG